MRVCALDGCNNSLEGKRIVARCCSRGHTTKLWYANNAQRQREYARQWRIDNPGWEKRQKINNPQVVMCGWAKKRAKKAGIHFDITSDDIVIPEICPVLGIPLMIGGRGNGSSPSLDRLVPDLGYVPDNIRVISYRANRIKGNATAEELRAIVDYIDRETDPDKAVARIRIMKDD